MTRSSNNKRDEHWVRKTFLPLLRLLDIYNIPSPGESKKVNLADHRDFIINGMGQCIVNIRQENLPKKIGGLLITSHKVVSLREGDDTNSGQIDSFRLNILINSHLCNKTSHMGRLWFKLATIHEFTHAVAALSAISRVRSDELINRLKEILHKKSHTLDYKGIFRIFMDLSEPLFVILSNKRNGIPKRWYFNDYHFRLGFEDIPVSYPIIFEEFLLPNEVFEAYFLPDRIRIMCWSYMRNNAVFNLITRPVLRRIYLNEALPMEFIKRRFFLNFFLPKIFN